VYKTSPPGSLEPKIRSIKHHIYDVKANDWTKFTSTILELSSHGGPRSCLKGPGLIRKRMPFPLVRWRSHGDSWHIGTVGEQVFLSSFNTGAKREFRDGNGNIIAISENRASTDPLLETMVAMDDKTLNALVTLWCTTTWFECRKIKRTQNLESYNKFGKFTRFEEFDVGLISLQLPTIRRKNLRDRFVFTARIFLYHFSSYEMTILDLAGRCRGLVDWRGCVVLSSFIGSVSASHLSNASKDGNGNSSGICKTCAESGTFDSFDETCREVGAPSPGLNKTADIGKTAGATVRETEVKDCQWRIKQAVSHFIETKYAVAAGRWISSRRPHRQGGKSAATLIPQDSNTLILVSSFHHGYHVSSSNEI
jgi:hypothetical protein